VKILWVKGGGLIPPDVGLRIRSYYLLRELAKRHQITLFTFYAAHPADEHQRLETMFERVVCMPLKIAARRSAREYASFLRQSFSPLPYSVTKYCRSEVADAVRDLVNGASFDVAVCDFILPALVFPWNMACPKVIFTHNVETLIWKRHVEVTRNPLWKLVAWREYRTMAAYEKRYLEKADHILTVSEVDRKYFSQLLGTRPVSVIPTGVDIDYFAPPERLEERPCSLIFVGSMDWMPNEEGVLFFIEHVLPAIRRQVPAVTLKIAGRSPSQKLRSIAASRGVEVTGTVDDIRPHVHAATVCIVPLRVGSGTRLKIFEAMAMGKAIVSTTLGAEGLPVKPGENLVLADAPEDFARETVRLLRDDGERVRLGAAARELVRHDYSWASVSTHFDEVLCRVTGRDRDHAPTDRSNISREQSRSA
jgi:polysaccharide biosynthesis protein PslH